MKDKNKKLIMLVGVLLVGIGISFAYFTSKLLGGGVGGNIDVTTAVINGSTLKVEGTLSFDDENILPGHKNISSIKVTAKGNNEIIPYNLIWNGINNLGTSLNFTVYKTNTEITTNINCLKETGLRDGKQTLNEKCTLTNEESLGEILSTETIEQNENETKTILVKDEVMTSSESGTEVYYYVILEYPNLNENQNADIGACFKGIVTVEKSEIKADVNILAVNISEDGESYTQTQDIPQSGYTLNKNKSTCTNGGVPNWDGINKRFYIDNLTKSGTNCMLYFDKIKYASEIVIATTTVKLGTNSFTGPATTGEGTQISTSEFNSSYNNDNAYVGYMYGITGQSTYEATHTNTNSSTIKGVLDNWYKTNILDKNYDSYVSKEAGFCGDRRIATTTRTNYTKLGYGTNSTAYAAVDRMMDASWNAKSIQTPTYLCNSNDLYTASESSKGNKALQYPVGLISADEILYAGGFGGKTNSSYWLYTSQYYWTMSPSYVSSAVGVFRVEASGGFGWDHMYNVTATYGVRPVINLLASVQLTGSGTTADPFIIVA